MRRASTALPAALLAAVGAVAAVMIARRMSRGSRAALLVALGAGAAALGFACGSASTASPPPARPLPEAGSPHDDGSGMLARFSGRGILGEGEAGGETYGGDAYGSGYGDEYGDGHAYGGDLYGGWGYGGLGGETYAGTVYGGYQFRTELYSDHPPSPYGDGYTVTAVANPATITGRVTWPRPPAAPAELTVAASGACDGAIPNPTLVLGERGAVANAVVYLESIASGRAYPTGHAHQQTAVQVGGTVAHERCALAPHIQVAAPIGALLTIGDDDEGRRAFVGRKDGDESFRIELRGRGSRGRATLDEAGFYRIDNGAAASAWVVVPPHPYYAITDDRGRFRLDQVPPGRYRLVVWHEPVAEGVGADGRPIYGEPVITRTTVRARPRAVTSVDVALPRR